MWVLGLEMSVAELLTVFSGIIVLCILYLAYEIFKLKKVEKRLEKVEKMFEREEKELEREVKKLDKKK
jgi:biopolymer transport protein ExbB/TolQ